ncbi:MAG: ABC transporter permease [Sphingobium sp.]
MWRNYLTVGLRALAKQRAYAFINILGLALGLSACILILLYVRYETSYDGWMPGADRAYQVQTFYKPNAHGGEEMKLQMSSIVSGRALKKDFPQVEKLVYIRAFSPIVIQDGVASQVEDLRTADGNLFEILQVPFVRGDRLRALSDPNSIVLSEREAKKRFGDADPVGKTLTIAANVGNVDYRVTGVYRDFPRNSHFSASMVARFDPEVEYANRPQMLTSWNNQGGWNYVKLREGADVEAIRAAIPAWKKRNIPDDVAGSQRTNPGDVQDTRLTAIQDVHLGEAQVSPLTPGNDRRTVMTFGVVALLVLGMACVNFTNLATARASQRAREVALRKVLGASRGQLIAQFLGESILVAGIAMIVALGAVELVLPGFNAFLDADIALRYFGSGGIALPAVLLVLLVGVAGGLYPALYLSRFQPARILKANKSAADAEGSGRLRNALVIAQFAVSIGLMICTAIIYGQTVYARTLDAGYQRDGLLQVGNLGFKGASEDAVNAFVERVRRIPGVQAAARTQIGVSPGNNAVSGFFLPGATHEVQLGTYGVEAGFMKAMGIKLLAGRDFSLSQGRDDATTPFPVQIEAERALAARGVNVVISQEASRRLGYASPAAAIGKTIRAALTLNEVGLVPATIVGVVADTRYRSIHQPLQPIVYTMTRNGFSDAEVRFAGVSPSQLREQVAAVWTQLIPTVPFNAEFADDLVARQYDREASRATLFAAFALLAVVIGCLGLFGLAAFTAERRTREIGIRKVLGAGTGDIVRLLVWQFSRPVLIANLIAWPVAWWIMRDWLNNFDRRIGLTPLPFAAAGLVALVIAVATIGTHAWRVAQTSPVKALRYE